MKPICVRCSLTEKMYRSYMNFHVLGKKKDLIVHLIGCLLFLLFGLSNLRAGSPLFGWMFVVISIYLFVSRYLRFYMSVNRLADQHGLSDQPKYFYTITFKSHALSVENEKELADYGYDRIYHAYFMEKASMLYLYMNKQTAFLIPYACMKPEDLPALRSFLEEKLSPEKISVQ